MSHCNQAYRCTPSYDTSSGMLADWGSPDHGTLRKIYNDCTILSSDLGAARSHPLSQYHTLNCGNYDNKMGECVVKELERQRYLGSFRDSTIPGRMMKLLPEHCGSFLG